MREEKKEYEMIRMVEDCYRMVKQDTNVYKRGKTIYRIRTIVRKNMALVKKI